MLPLESYMSQNLAGLQICTGLMPHWIMCVCQFSFSYPAFTLTATEICVCVISISWCTSGRSDHEHLILFYHENHHHPVGMVSFFFQLMERSIHHLQHSTPVIWLAHTQIHQSTKEPKATSSRECTDHFGSNFMLEGKPHVWKPQIVVCQWNDAIAPSSSISFNLKPNRHQQMNGWQQGGRRLTTAPTTVTWQMIKPINAKGGNA
jgi:hypothetical protein